jgi:membrane-associated phospholipid phosphatase
MFGFLALLAPTTRAVAQYPLPATSPRTRGDTVASHREAWAASGVLLAAALVFDERIRTIALVNHTTTLDHLAAGADVLGTAGHIVPALVATYVSARVLGKHHFAAAALRTGLSYAAADAVESILKPTIGRERPFVGREPLTFRPFSLSGDYQSFPSAHVVHISSLAAAVAEESDRSWVTALGAAAMMYVGAQRVYRDQHWSSDVVASGMLGVEVARLATGWLRRWSVTGAGR